LRIHSSIGVPRRHVLPRSDSRFDRSGVRPRTMIPSASIQLCSDPAATACARQVEACLRSTIPARPPLGPSQAAQPPAPQLLCAAGVAARVRPEHGDHARGGLPMALAQSNRWMARRFPAGVEGNGQGNHVDRLKLASIHGQPQQFRPATGLAAGLSSQSTCARAHHGTQTRPSTSLRLGSAL